MHSSWIVLLNLSKWALSLGFLTLECLWLISRSRIFFVSHFPNSGPWSDCRVLIGNGTAFLICSMNLRLLCVLIFSEGAAYAKREQTSSPVYKYILSPGAPSWIVSISTNIPGFWGTGRFGYWCHFFHREKRVKPLLLSTLFTEERETLIPSCVSRWCRISAHWFLWALISRMLFTISRARELGWWRGREERVGMSLELWCIVFARFIQFDIAWCENRKCRATERTEAPASTMRTASIRSLGRRGLFSYAIYMILAGVVTSYWTITDPLTRYTKRCILDL